MTTATAAPTRTKASPAVLKSVLGPDGKLKYTLPAKEAKKLAAAMELCHLLSNVTELEDVVSPAIVALEVLSNRLCQTS